MLTRKNALAWGLSGVLHVAVAAGIWAQRPARVRTPPVPITVEIRHRPAPRPEPLAMAAPAEVARPQPVRAPERPPPPSPPRRSVAHPASESPPPAAAPPLPAAAPAEGVPVAAPVAAATPAPGPSTAGPAAPAPAPTPAPAGRSGGRGGHGVDLAGYLGRVNHAVAARRRYPAMAVQMQLEGDAVVAVRVHRDGSLASRPTLHQSCGHELLDSEALRMVADAAPLPSLPADYAELTAELRIPVRFRLED